MIRQGNKTKKSQKLFLAFHKSIFPLKQLKQSVSQILLLSSQFPSLHSVNNCVWSLFSLLPVKGSTGYQEIIPCLRYWERIFASLKSVE